MIFSPAQYEVTSAFKDHQCDYDHSDQNNSNRNDHTSNSSGVIRLCFQLHISNLTVQVSNLNLQNEGEFIYSIEVRATAVAVQ